MIRLIDAELFKLRTTRLYLVLLLAATGLVVLVTALHFILGGEAALSIEGAAGTVETEADLRSLLDVSGVAMLFTLILGATAVSGEDRHRTIATTFLLTPARGRVVVAKMIGYVFAGLLFGAVVEVAALVVAVGWLVASGTPVPFGPSVVAGLALTPVVSGLAAGFGVGVGAALPSQLAAVLAALGWAMVVEQLLGGILPRVADWLPFTGAGSAVAGQHPHLGAAAGLGLFLGYVALVVGLGLVVTRRRDIA